ncbi:alpha/beta-hydrolase [Panaeolus papilionaceus]|nr:alpha/beta-hydrolase [Panaeolus papilionaceus]
MAPQKAPYGTWNSPITAESITKGANSITEILVDPVTSEIYHLESRPSEKGRNVVVHTSTNTDVVGQGWNVRTMVQEYGGAPATVYDSILYFSSLTDGRVYRAGVKGETPEPITPADKPYRYSTLTPHPTSPHLLVSILEDHTNPLPAEVQTTLVTINTTTKTVHPLVKGADFYGTPRFSPDGKKLSWTEWYHPDMPWEGGIVYVADVAVKGDALSVSNPKRVAGEKEKVAAGYATWASDNTLIFITDVSGYMNPWRYDYTSGKATPLFATPVPEDFGYPMWVLNYFPYTILDSAGKTGLFTAMKEGRYVFYSVDLEGGIAPTFLPSPFAVVESLVSVNKNTGEVVFTGQKTTEKTSIVQCTLSDLQDGSFKVLKAPKKDGDSKNELPTDHISEPRPITLEVGPSKQPLHVIYYPPFNPAYEGSSIEGEKPPCVVNVHGGPTGLTTQGLNWGKQYFTSRGWGWLDVNYGGSSGYGREYVLRLASNWGLVDVADCINSASLLSAAPYSLIDPKRAVIRGGSAGGFTVLAALSIAELVGKDNGFFAGATSLYGVSDLAKLSEFTHKFESRYLDKLVGGTFSEIPEVYKQRSPVFHADKIVTPLLILQGEIDMVVPKEQAETIYKSIKERGGVVEYKLYAGEGHGWRQEPNMRDAYERELGFYERVLGLKN